MPGSDRVRLELPDRSEVAATIEPHLLGQAFDAVVGNALQASDGPVLLRGYGHGNGHSAAAIDTM